MYSYGCVPDSVHIAYLQFMGVRGANGQRCRLHCRRSSWHSHLPALLQSCPLSPTVNQATNLCGNFVSCLYVRDSEHISR